MSPAAQDSPPLGESGIYPTLESSGPGAKGLPLLQKQEKSLSEEENEVITEFHFNYKSYNYNTFSILIPSFQI